MPCYHSPHYIKATISTCKVECPETIGAIPKSVCAQLEDPRSPRIASHHNGIAIQPNSLLGLIPNITQLNMKLLMMLADYTNPYTFQGECSQSPRPCSTSGYLQGLSPRVRILDLGSAYFVGQSPPPPFCTPIHYAAPEVVFPLMAEEKNGSWDCCTNIWSLACTIHEIACGGRPLLRKYGSFILDEMAELCSGAPDEWIQHLDSVPGYVSREGYTSERADELWAACAERLEKAGQASAEARGLVTLLRRMLVIDPGGRATATELLQDPYFAAKEVEAKPSDCTPRPSVKGDIVVA
ncbi:kinase-like domain-containing protein [Mycena epipterygia]|nr:kinase-like domain-containing protein [Mycena epipterygia]